MDNMEDREVMLYEYHDLATRQSVHRLHLPLSIVRRTTIQSPAFWVFGSRFSRCPLNARIENSAINIGRMLDNLGKHLV